MVIIMKKVSLIIFRLISILLIAFAILMIIGWFDENKENKEVTDYLVDIAKAEEEQTEKNYPILNVDFQDLVSKNEDTVGWIKVNNTNINYSVVQTTDNDFYLTHNFYKKTNSAGWIFADYRNDLDELDINTVIYGHNRKDESMFSTLKLTQNEMWHKNEENKYIFFNTLNKKMTWEVFSIYTVKAETYCTTIDFEDSNEHQKFLNTIRTRSINDFDIEVSQDDKILTLYTCADNNNERIVMHAKLVYFE